VYPKNPLFRKGILDLRHFKVERDGENAYFTVTMGALSQPGWHPEYGFQLTMLAIGIDQTGDAAQQARSFRHNSRYTLPKKQGFDKLILVGGGVQVRDKDDGILAEFVPHSESDAIGDVRTSTISFAIPLSILGPNIGTWTYNIIVGAQDDHGGAGIGEFREVQAQPSEWNGGGNTSGGTNVYDTMFAAPR
jgi:carbohydrate-binding DOMON domain-containing protein